MPVDNEEIVQLFENMATLLEMKGDTVFKIRAYQRAARTIDQLSFPLEQAVQDRADLKKIPGIGKAISEKIQELLQTGQVAAYDKLLEELPDGVLNLMDIPGIGPKTAMLLSQELGVGTVEELEDAIQAGKLASLPRMGQKDRREHPAEYSILTQQGHPHPHWRGPEGSRRDHCRPPGEVPPYRPPIPGGEPAPLGGDHRRHRPGGHLGPSRGGG